jgi:hypothetical protein
LSPEELRSAILSEDSKTFVRQRLFGPGCWLFDQIEYIAPEADYTDFRNDVSDLFDVNPNNITLVGSAKLGYSLSPTKPLRPFNPGPKGSDLDCAVVSEGLFKTAVGEIQSAYFEGHRGLFNRHGSQIFAGHLIVSSEEDYKSKHLDRIAKDVVHLGAIASKLLRIEVPLKYRIYESWEVAERYHIQGLQQLKDAMEDMQ